MYPIILQYVRALQSSNQPAAGKGSPLLIPLQTHSSLCHGPAPELPSGVRDPHLNTRILVQGSRQQRWRFRAEHLSLSSLLN